MRFRAALARIFMQKYNSLYQSESQAAADRVECCPLANRSPADLLHLPKLITDVRHGQWWEIYSLHRKWQSGLGVNHCWTTRARKGLLELSLQTDNFKHAAHLAALLTDWTQRFESDPDTKPHQCSGVNRTGGGGGERECVTQSVLKDLGELCLASD